WWVPMSEGPPSDTEGDCVQEAAARSNIAKYLTAHNPTAIFVPLVPTSLMLPTSGQADLVRQRDRLPSSCCRLHPLGALEKLADTPWDALPHSQLHSAQRRVSQPVQGSPMRLSSICQSSTQDRKVYRLEECLSLLKELCFLDSASFANCLL